MKSPAQRWLVACAFGVLFTGVSLVKGNWAPAIVLGALTIFAGVIGGLRWRRAGG